MAFEPGGYADKLGNRYEGRWIAKQFLRLLNEQIRSVVVEAIGDDERGVDLWIEFSNGIRQAQQCKGRNASKEAWTLADLNARGILAAMRSQLDRDTDSQFALVTAIPATVFGDICESARNSSGSPEDFYNYQIQRVGEHRRKLFRQFCEFLRLDRDTEADRAIAFDYLLRNYIHLWPDDQNSRNELLGWAGMLVTGESETVISSLAAFAQDNLRKRLIAQDVRNHLSSLELHPRRLSHDTRIAPAIEELQTEFDDSIEPLLVANELIPRDETRLLLQILQEDGIVVLHGAAGYGKSGVLYELTRLLRADGHLWLPLRLDRRHPTNTPRQFGQDLGLPESPALCLEALAGDRIAVLILDQLDALRWTSSHSGSALDVCKRLAREVKSLRSMGTQIGIVLACRTFDLEHDPEIKDWLKDSAEQKCRKVVIKGLPDEHIKKVVGQCGHDFSLMTQKQRVILQSPQHLAMWAKIVQSGDTPDFQTPVQLMRRFWESRYLEFAKIGLSAYQVDEVIDALTRHMNRRGIPSAPKSLVDDRPQVVEALHSHGVIQTTRHWISFCHQSYLDFRIASRLLKEIYQGQGTLLSWLGTRAQQSLFRREQLKLALFLLLEESPTDYLVGMQEILDRPDVRFHLKHLALEVTGQIEQPPIALCEYLSHLHGDDYWREHVLETVYYGRSPHLLWLIETGIIAQWLEAADSKRANEALWLLRSVSDKLPDVISSILEPYASRDQDWREKVRNCLCWNEKDDSDRMFELRLNLVRHGVYKNWVNWKELAASHPLRAIRLIDAIISTWSPEDILDRAQKSGSTASRESRLERWSSEELQSLKNASSQYPEYVWDQFVPHIERLTALITDWPHLEAWGNDEMLSAGRGYTFVCRGIVEMAIEAGKSLVKQDARRFLDKTQSFYNSGSLITQFVLAETYSTLPPSHADVAIQWLISQPCRLKLSTGYREHEWMPAARLIKNLSPHCSEKVFKQLESFIIHYHSPDEKRMAEYYLSGWKEGIFGDYWGRAQYLLLPMLSPERQSVETMRLVSVLKRKFGGYSARRFWRHGTTRGGTVVSPLPKDGLEKISDRAWLRIVRNEAIPERHGVRWKQRDDEHVAESSVFHFAHDLARIAQRFPERFGRLALQFPENVNSGYLTAILEGLKQTRPPEIPENEKATWCPASSGTIEAFLGKFPLGEDLEVGMSFCWLVKERPDEPWSGGTIARLIDYAVSHPDPKPGKLNINCDVTADDASVDLLHQNTLNCLRAVAAQAIGALLWVKPDLLPTLQQAIEHFVLDPHPVVRMAALEACLPVLNTNRDLAVNWFASASRGDMRIAASPRGVYFFNSAMQSHFDVLAVLIRGMLESSREDVVRQGSMEVTARWLFHGMFEEELGLCRQGSEPQRRGVARIVSHFISRDEYSIRCQELLSPLFEDEDSEVRQETRQAFRNQSILTIPDAGAFIRMYVHSKAFADDPSPFLYVFESYSGSLIPYADLIYAVCEVFAGPLRSDSRNMTTGIAGDVSMIPPLLLRLYEQAQDQDNVSILTNCLDAWDILFEGRIGTTRDLTSAIQQ